MSTLANAKDTVTMRDSTNASGATQDTKVREVIAAQVLTPDLCVIGAGSGGLSVAAAAAQLGVSVVLIEKHLMGGDCLNSGCVPSKALIAAGKHAHAMRSGRMFGIRPVEPEIDSRGVRDHVHSVIATIAPNDSVERFTGLGVQVIQAAGYFVDPSTVAAGEYRIRARRFIVATGSSAGVPPIAGLKDTPFYTNETVFDIAEPIGHLIVIGAGPIGMELAQAHRRLGAKVTVLEGRTALAKDDPELTAVALKRLKQEGVQIFENVSINLVSGVRGAIVVAIQDGGETRSIEGTHLLVAAGRKPNVADLGLDAGKVVFGPQGIKVDAKLKTSNKRVMAIGDVTGGLQFTHVANYHAGIVIRRALFRLPAKVNNDLVPWVTYTDPEIANVGLTEAQARERGIAVNVYRWPYSENDRAQAERETDGLVKVVCDKRGRILGAGIVGAHAGELIQMWSLALSQGLKISAMTQWISPYPSFSEINKRAAFGYLAGKGSSPVVRKLLSFLRKFG
ncbi:MAG: FAD-dependent oxidoreductase [Hyphomicrobiaceae bacterium]